LFVAGLCSRCGEHVREEVMAAEGGVGVLGRMLGPYGVLRGNRNLQLLFGGQVVSSFGDWLYILALGILAYEITGSATVVAVLTFARLLPYAVLLPLSGMLADRGNRKVLMISADLGRGACMLGLLFAGSEETLWIAYPLVFLATVFSSLFQPAMSSVLPAIVGDEEKLVEANSIWSQMDSVSFVLGPALGGVLALLGAPELAYVINGATFLVSAATLLFVRIPPREAPETAEGDEEESWLSETLAGFKFLFRENEGVLAALTISFVSLSFVGGGIWTLILVLSDEAFGLGTEGSGFLNSVYGVGGVVGGLAAGYLASKVRLGPAVIWSIAAGSVVLLLLGVSPAGVLPFVILFVVGILDTVVDVNGTTIIQTGTPEDLLGRVFGAFDGVLIFAMLTGALIVGPAIELLEARATTVVFAVAGLVIFLLCLPRLRKLDRVLGVRMFVRKVPVLSGLSHAVLEDLASRMTLEKVPAGTAVVSQGEVGDRLYIVKDGEAEVVARGDYGQEKELATLSKNDYFGEIALLKDVPRTATVRAKGTLELYSLEREDFRALLERSEKLKSAMTGTSDARYVETQNRLLLRR
jgi:MFS family permease